MIESLKLIIVSKLKETKLCKVSLSKIE